MGSPGGVGVTVLAVDPGTEESAFVLFDGQRVLQHATEPNADLLARLVNCGFSHAIHEAVFEQVESFGMPVGREVFETVFWTGRFFEAVALWGGTVVDRLPRRVVKLHLCSSARAKDANIRCAILDRFGGKEQAIGRKAAQGPLFGIKSHEYAALAVALTWLDQRATARLPASA